jgi:hypothetical protein
MIRNSSLLSALRECHQLNVEQMLKVITAGEEDGRKCNPNVFEQETQTEQIQHSVDSLIIQDEQMDEISLKVQNLENEIEKIKHENELNEAKAQREIERFKNE